MMNSLLDWRRLELRYSVAYFLPVWLLLIILKRSRYTYFEDWVEWMRVSMRKRMNLN